MIDLDGALRADADRWKAAQTLSLDLDAALEDAVAAPHRTRRRSVTVVAAAAAVVLVTGGVALIADHFDTRAAHRPAGDVSVPATAHSNTPPTTPVPSISAPVRLAGLGAPPAGQRTLLRASGHDNRTWNIEQATGRGEIYAACVGGGTIKIDMPGHGGFDVNCTGIPAGASLPTLGRTVQISRVAGEEWHIAVFGR